jgi:hypothetical protein
MMNFKLERCWCLLGDSRRGDTKVNLARLLDNRVHGILDTRLVVRVDLREKFVSLEFEEGPVRGVNCHDTCRVAFSGYENGGVVVVLPGGSC